MELVSIPLSSTLTGRGRLLTVEEVVIVEEEGVIEAEEETAEVGGEAMEEAEAVEISEIGAEEEEEEIGVVMGVIEVVVVTVVVASDVDTRLWLTPTHLALEVEEMPRALTQGPGVVKPSSSVFFSAFTALLEPSVCRAGGGDTYTHLRLVQS